MLEIYHCFPEGKHKVLTMSYDDGRIEDRRLVQIFNENGIKGTFHINSGLLYDPNRIQLSEMKELYAGHEIATHTSTHPTIARCPSEYIVAQVMEDRKQLEKVAGYPVKGLSYPNGSFDNRIKEMLPLLGIKYSRVVGSSNNFGMPKDFYEWQATCHHRTELMKRAEEFTALFKKQYLYMMYVWGHSYEFTAADNWDLIEGFCKYIGHREDIWYATNIQIVDYMEVLERLQFSADCSIVHNPSAQSAWLSVNKHIFEIKGGETCYFNEEELRNE